MKRPWLAERRERPFVIVFLLDDPVLTRAFDMLGDTGGGEGYLCGLLTAVGHALAQVCP
jgi:hypothetical protein